MQFTSRLPFPCAIPDVFRRWRCALAALLVMAFAGLAPAADAKPAVADAKPAVSEAKGSETAAKPYITWFNVPKKPNPLLAHHSYESAAMKTKVGYRIYLPPGYADAGNDTRYPVIYWLHGRTGSEATDSFPAATVDKAVREKTIPPVIMVFGAGGGLSWYADSPDGKWMAETTVIKELIPHIDSTYRTIPKREARAIQGMSMGGYGAMKFALKYPELFSSVVAFAPSFRTAEEMRVEEIGPIIENMFGGEPARFTAEHPETLIRKNADTLRDKVKIKMLMGTKDKPVLLGAFRKFHKTLTELNVPHEYTEIEGIEHNLGKLAAAVKTEALEFAVKHFEK